MKGGSKNFYSHVSTVEIIDKTVSKDGPKTGKYQEELIEHIIPIKECKDEMIDLFLKL